jgi:phage shock protein PspC (stress-responsive transcriptional regulator)
MPSLVRFLAIVSAVAGLGFGGLYVLSTVFEPEQTETRSSVPGVKVRR